MKNLKKYNISSMDGKILLFFLCNTSQYPKSEQSIQLHELCCLRKLNMALAHQIATLWKTENWIQVSQFWVCKLCKLLLTFFSNYICIARDKWKYKLFHFSSYQMVRICDICDEMYPIWSNSNAPFGINNGLILNSKSHRGIKKIDILSSSNFNATIMFLIFPPAFRLFSVSFDIFRSYTTFPNMTYPGKKLQWYGRNKNRA